MGRARMGNFAYSSIHVHSSFVIITVALRPRAQMLLWMTSFWGVRAGQERRERAVQRIGPELSGNEKGERLSV